MTYAGFSHDGRLDYYTNYYMDPASCGAEVPLRMTRLAELSL